MYGIERYYEDKYPYGKDETTGGCQEQNQYLSCGSNGKWEGGLADSTSLRPREIVLASSKCSTFMNSTTIVNRNYEKVLPVYTNGKFILNRLPTRFIVFDIRFNFGLDDFNKTKTLIAMVALIQRELIYTLLTAEYNI